MTAPTTPAASDRSGDGARTLDRAIVGLLAIGAVAYASASAVHSGLAVSVGPIALDDPFPGAAIPEAIIAVALAAGAFGLVVRWQEGWRLAAGVVVFAIVFTLLGATITARSGRGPDLAYHAVLLVLLAVIAVLLAVRFRSHRSTAA